MRILVTRPQPQADKTADKLVAMGHEVVIEPQLVFNAMAVPADTVRGLAALIVTSSRAIEALGHAGLLADLASVPIFCVGQASGRAAVAAGFRQVKIAGGDVGSLLRSVVAAKPEGRVLYAAGVERSGNLVGELENYGILSDLQEVYRMVAVKGFSSQVHTYISGGKIDCALFYSPRSLKVFLQNCHLEKVADFLNSMKVLCISERVASLAKPFSQVSIAEAPTEEALFSLLPSTKYDRI